MALARAPAAREAPKIRSEVITFAPARDKRVFDGRYNSALLISVRGSKLPYRFTGIDVNPRVGGARGRLSGSALIAAVVCALQRRARNRAVGTKNAAIARSGPQQRFTVLTFIKVLACVNWHLLALDVPAQRARQNRFQNDGGH